MSQSSLRVFFAYELSPNEKIGLMPLSESLSDHNLKPVPPANFHITLTFLGQTSESKIETILDHFSLVDCSPFCVEAREYHWFKKSKILSLAIDDENNHLKKLKQTIDQNLSSIDLFMYDKKDFVPHITLAREAEVATNELPKLANLPNLSFEIKNVSLLASVASPSGIYYETIETWPLKIQRSAKAQLLGF